jgi:hypothetical protein
MLWLRHSERESVNAQLDSPCVVITLVDLSSRMDDWTYRNAAIPL